MSDLLSVWDCPLLNSDTSSSNEVSFSYTLPAMWKWWSCRAFIHASEIMASCMNSFIVSCTCHMTRQITWLFGAFHQTLEFSNYGIHIRVRTCTMIVRHSLESVTETFVTKPYYLDQKTNVRQSTQNLIYSDAGCSRLRRLKFKKRVTVKSLGSLAHEKGSF